MSHHHPQQLQAWLARCRANLADFNKNRHTLAKEEQIEFIRNQHLILKTGIKVVKGQARFEGL